MPSTRLLPGLLAVTALSLSACSLLTPDEAITPAEDQWGSLPDAARSALGVEGGTGSPTGAVAEIWTITSPVDLDRPAGDGVLADPQVSGCLAVADALAGTGVEAFGVLPLSGDLVLATTDTCRRGLSAGPWGAPSVRVEDSAGRTLENSTLQLGRSSGGRAELWGLEVDLREGTLSTSSETPPWSWPLRTPTVSELDTQLAAVAVPVPAGPLPSPDDAGTLVVRTEPGVQLRVVAACGGASRVDGIDIDRSYPSATSWTVWANGAEPAPDEADAAHVGCGGAPAQADLLPSLRWTDATGEQTDLTVLSVDSIEPGGLGVVQVEVR